MQRSHGGGAELGHYHASHILEHWWQLHCVVLVPDCQTAARSCPKATTLKTDSLLSHLKLICSATSRSRNAVWFQILPPVFETGQ
jgi:hypothetical protein